MARPHINCLPVGLHPRVGHGRFLPLEHGYLSNLIEPPPLLCKERKNPMLILRMKDISHCDTRCPSVHFLNDGCGGRKVSFCEVYPPCSPERHMTRYRKRKLRLGPPNSQVREEEDGVIACQKGWFFVKCEEPPSHCRECCNHSWRSFSRDDLVPYVFWGLLGIPMKNLVNFRLSALSQVFF